MQNIEIYFYGCTIDVSGTWQEFNALNTLAMYDCSLLTENVQLGPFNVLKMSDNITNNINFSSSLYQITDLTYYNSPVYNASITQTPDYPVGLDFKNYYTIETNLRYYNFVVSGGAPLSFRETYDFNNGLFNFTRLSYGAYSFNTETINPLSADNGHIGAFYFGDDYTNGIVVVDPVEINLTTDTDIINVSGNNQGLAAIRLIAPENIAIGVNPFDFDFSGTPVSGSTPLNVKFHAYNYEPKGQYEELWEAAEFRWWFDYATSGGINDYVSCASDRAEHLYCGFYGDEYDVRLCVIYQLI